MTTLLIILVLVATGSLSVTAIWRDSRLPEWAGQEAGAIWGRAFFDKRVWLKSILIKIFRIKILKPPIILGVFLYKIFSSAFRIAKKSIIKNKT